MNRFSLRTLMLGVMGFAILCGLFCARGMNVNAVHLLLVLAFAIPGGSYGYDVGRSSRSAVIGTCTAAMGGSLLVSLCVLILDLLTL